MLQSLAIKNFALIDDLKISFSEGYTIITGETGAGKSILLDALSLILGKRADLSALRNSDEKCIIEAEFTIKNYNLSSIFKEEEIDYEDITIIRREILPSGKSRAFINDSPVTLDILSRLGKILVDIHSQHDTQQLGDEDFQLYITDTLAENEKLLENYQQELKTHKKNTKKLKELSDFQKNAKKEHDYNTFILEELQKAELEDGMQEELEEYYGQASNIEEIKQNLSEASSLLSNEEYGIMSQLLDLKNTIEDLSDYGGQYNELYERLDETYIELDDIAREIYDLTENVDFDPRELQKVQRKLQKIYDLQKKHNVQSVAELITIQEDLEKKVSKLENIEEEINTQKKEVAKSLKIVTKCAEKIHLSREKTLPKLTEMLQNMLSDLGMPNAKFLMELKKTENFLPKGNDELSFLFSANKGGNFGTLKKTASGGELSRIMLTIKSILATKIALPTIIFDEIDTGVSGEISHKMGEIMKLMSQTRQVFAITHLPQVASKGREHIKVFKSEINGKTTTQFKKLTENERVEEIAQMLGGKDITDSARQHARQLLGMQ